MSRLDLDQLQVTSFETSTAPPEAALPAASGEDCFTPMSVCCTTTFTPTTY